MTRRTKSLIVIIAGTAVMWALFFSVRFPALLDDLRKINEVQLNSTYRERASSAPSKASVRELMDDVLQDHPGLKERTEKLFRQVGFASNDIDSLQAQLLRLAALGSNGTEGFDLICASGASDDLTGIIRHVVHESSLLCANGMCTDHVIELTGHLDLVGTGPQWCERTFRDRTLEDQVQQLEIVRTCLLAFVQEVVLSYDFPASDLPKG